MSAIHVARLLAKLIDKVPEIAERTDVRFVPGSIQRQMDLKELVGFTYKISGEVEREFVVMVGERDLGNVIPLRRVKRRRKS